MANLKTFAREFTNYFGLIPMSLVGNTNLLSGNSSAILIRQQSVGTLFALSIGGG
jgi:hypothetical protein